MKRRPLGGLTSWPQSQGLRGLNDFVDYQFNIELSFNFVVKSALFITHNLFIPNDTTGRHFIEILKKYQQTILNVYKKKKKITYSYKISIAQMLVRKYVK